MTFFQIADEYERDFEELELENIEDCAWATLLYVQLGHLSAKRMTDGLVSPAMLRKRTAAWAPGTVDEALASLERLGKVTRTADGGVQFVDWDLTQFTREQETRRRAHAAERQRRRRAKLAEEAAARPPEPSHETIAENDNVTRDVTPPSASSSLPTEEISSPTEKRVAPTRPGPSKARPRDDRKAVLTSVLVAAAKQHGFIAVGLLSAKQAETVLGKAAALAKREGCTLEEALRRAVQGGWERHQATGKELKWCVVDWQPGQPARPSYGRPPKLEIAGCSPASEFESEEVALAKVRARRAEIEAMKAAKELRHVGT